MSKKRFVFLRKVIRFDEPETRNERKKDRFAAFRDFFECWNGHCSHVVIPGDLI